MKTVIAYSGGLDTSAAIVWLKQIKKVSRVDAVLVDVGQKEDLEAHSKKALQLGADSVVTVDCKDAFCEFGIGPLLKATAKYESQYLLGTAIARPFIADAIMKICGERGAEAVCHGATGKGNDYLRFEQRMLTLNPDIHIISPWREWQLGGRREASELLERSGVSFPVKSKSPFDFSTDAYLWHTSYEGGSLENLNLPLPTALSERMLQTGSCEITVDWENGLPVACNGKPMPLSQLIETLNLLLAPTGYGWVDLVETRTNGLKSRGVYYTPAGTLLYACQEALMACYFSGPVLDWFRDNSALYAQLIYEGHWEHPLLKALNLAFDSFYQGTAGKIQLEVRGAQAVIQKRWASPSKFNSELSGFESMQLKAWDHSVSQSLVQIQQMKWNSKPFALAREELLV